MKNKVATIIEDLRSVQKPRRFQHILNVSDAAKQLAKKYGADEESAYLAGLLHDLAKPYYAATMLKKAEAYQLTIDPIYRSDPQLLHGLVGARVSQEQYGIEDRDILNAIAYHTTGRAGMSRLEKIVYLADYIEVSRDFPGVDALRKAAFKDLDAAVLLAFEQTIIFLIDRHKMIHTNTIIARNDLIQKRKNRKENNQQKDNYEYQ